MKCVADFCLIPMGTEASVTKYIAEAQKVLEKSGLKYELHGYGTNLEGEWSEVMLAIEACHDAVHKMGCPRVATDIRIGTRIDKDSSNEHKKNSVIEYLGKQDNAFGDPMESLPTNDDDRGT
ncbi:hypothetical protein P389DRAFT_98593 [Cystobasidium minutum MCA 4210]|uniref:uncharacterized protein n=1 Tax=Cystobasidium minutum MCA 4210 TaxID=1397322 RepID=UPI0034CE67E2|eukprot:jgi/Rhomi1/98593/CE98592_882